MIEVVARVPALILPICHYCSKPRREWEVIRMAGGVIRCCYCDEWHRKAIADFSQNPSYHCQECGISFDEQQNSSTQPDTQVRCFLVPKDGGYQVLCQSCSKQYVPKRRDLVRGTEYAKRTGLD